MIMIDNAAYGIYNDGTHPTATTDGINRALIELSGNGLTQVGLSPGTYLIPADGYISIPRWTTLDLNGAVIKKKPNSSEAYKIIYMTNDHSEIRNGTIHGDKNEHDYSNGATHEGGYGVLVSGARFTRLENLEIKDCTGDGVAVGNDGFAYLSAGMTYFSNPKLGKFSQEVGWDTEAHRAAYIEDSNQGWVVFPQHKLDIEKEMLSGGNLIGTRFQVGGNGYDKVSLDIESFIMTFYDKKGTYLGHSAPALMGDDIYTDSLVQLYPSLRYICFSFKTGSYEEAKIAVNGWGAGSIPPSLRTTQMADHTEIIKCHIHHCRRQGITGGGKFLHVKDCHIHDIYGTAPSYGIDIEDGYSFNSMARIEGCRIENNAGGCIVCCNTRDVIIRDCQLRGLVRNGKGNGTGICFYSKDSYRNVVQHCQLVGLYNATNNAVYRDCIFIDCAVGGYVEDSTLIGCRLQASDSLSFDLNRCKLIRTGHVTQKIKHLAIRDCEITDCGSPNQYLFTCAGCDITFEDNRSINNARWDSTKDNSWPLINFTISPQNEPISSLHFNNNSYNFNNKDTVRGLFNGLVLQKGGVVEIKGNRLTAEGSIMCFGTLGSRGQTNFDIENNSFKTSYDSYLKSYYGIRIEGAENDSLVLCNNCLQLNKSNCSAIEIRDIPIAKIIDNRFDFGLVFRCDKARIYAENNKAPTIDFGAATVINFSQQANESKQPEKADAVLDLGTLFKEVSEQELGTLSKQMLTLEKSLTKYAEQLSELKDVVTNYDKRTVTLEASQENVKEIFDTLQKLFSNYKGENQNENN